MPRILHQSDKRVTQAVIASPGHEDKYEPVKLCQDPTCSAFDRG